MMEIIYKKIGEIKPYEKNAKKHDAKQIDNVAQSIKEFGWQQPIVIDAEGVIIVGHCRYAAAKKLKLKEVPCCVADNLTEEEVKKYRILDNKTNESEWDLDLLAEDIVGLDFSGFDLDFEIDLDVEGERADVVEDDYNEPLPQEPKSKWGDIYQLGRHRLMCGDSTDTTDVQVLMDGELADACVTDPPYNVSYEGKTDSHLTIGNDSMDNDSFFCFLRDAFCNMYMAMKYGAAFYVWHADLEGLNFRMALKEASLDTKQCLIWNKNSLVMGRQDYQWKHEPCLYGWKGGAPHLWASDRKQTTWEDRILHGA